MSDDRLRTLEIHPGTPETPDVDGLSDGAFRLLIAGLCYAIRQQTDMTIPASILPRLTPRFRASQVGELVSAGLWRGNGDGGYVIEVPVSRTYTDGRVGWRERVAPATRQAIPADVRTAVYERDGHRCRTCGATAGLTLDHIHPKSLGGDDSQGNLQTLCRPCNSRKGAKV